MRLLQMSLAGGVPLFMGDVKFATLLLPKRRDGSPAAAIWLRCGRYRE